MPALSSAGEWTFYTRILPEDCSQIQKHADQMIGLMAHELGHLWFTGADVSSWEDWLNETGQNGLACVT